MFTLKPGDQIITGKHGELGTVVEVQENPKADKYWSVKILRRSGDLRWTSVQK